MGRGSDTALGGERLTRDPLRPPRRVLPPAGKAAQQTRDYYSKLVNVTEVGLLEAGREGCERWRAA